MIKVIKHGNTVHTYKCPKCGCIFITNKDEVMLRCPECKYPTFYHNIIDNQEIIKDKLFEKVNIPSCWNIEDHNKKYEATHTSATTDDSIKR